MTENEKNIAFSTLDDIQTKIKRMHDIAYDALTELEQYRAIGTVKELKSKLEAYRELGTMEELKALKEKSEPKEPIIIDNRLNEIEWKCPVCGLNVIEEPPCQEYCQRCGNKLDWSE